MEQIQTSAFRYLSFFHFVFEVYHSWIDILYFDLLNALLFGLIRFTCLNYVRAAYDRKVFVNIISRYCFSIYVSLFCTYKWYRKRYKNDELILTKKRLHLFRFLENKTCIFLPIFICLKVDRTFGLIRNPLAK